MFPRSSDLGFSGTHLGLLTQWGPWVLLLEVSGAQLGLPTQWAAGGTYPLNPNDACALPALHRTPRRGARSRTIRTQEVQSASTVLHFGRKLTTFSHCTDPGAPECERCAQSRKRHDTTLALYGPQELQSESAVFHSGRTLTPLALHEPSSSRM